MRLPNLFGKPSILYAFISVSALLLLSFDFYEAIVNGRIMILRSAEYAQFDGILPEIIVFVMAFIVKLGVSAFSMYYLVYCILEIRHGFVCRRSRAKVVSKDSKRKSNRMKR